MTKSQKARKLKRQQAMKVLQCPGTHTEVVASKLVLAEDVSSLQMLLVVNGVQVALELCSLSLLL